MKEFTVYYTFEQLQAEKKARHLEYYKELEAIEKGLLKPTPEERGCRYGKVRTSTRKLVHPNCKSAL